MASTLQLVDALERRRRQEVPRGPLGESAPAPAPAPPAPGIPGSWENGSKHLPITEYYDKEGGPSRFDVNGYGRISGNYFDTREQAEAFANALLAAMQDDGGNFYDADNYLRYSDSLYRRVMNPAVAVDPTSPVSHPYTGIGDGRSSAAPSAPSAPIVQSPASTEPSAPTRKEPAPAPPVIPGSRKDGAKHLPITEYYGKNGEPSKFDVNGYGKISGNYFDTREQASAFADALLTAMQEDGENFYNDKNYLQYSDSLYRRVMNPAVAVDPTSPVSHPYTGIGNNPATAPVADQPSASATSYEPSSETRKEPAKPARNPKIPGSRDNGSKYYPVYRTKDANGRERYDVNGYGAKTGNYFDTEEQANAFADALLTATQDDGDNFFVFDNGKTIDRYTESLYRRIMNPAEAVDASSPVSHPYTGGGNADGRTTETAQAAPASGRGGRKRSSGSSEPAASSPSVSAPPVSRAIPAEDTAPVPSGQAVRAPQVDGTGSSFYDMLMLNDAYRIANRDAFERNEKANKARTTIAAISDALASLGNLVGTTQGAFSQPQTYQTPFVAEQVEADRARAIQLADRLQANDQTLRLTQAREDMSNGAYALRQALEEERTRRAMMNNEARSALSSQNATQKEKQLGLQHENRTAEIAQRGDITLKGVEMRNEQSDINNRRTTGTSAANNIRNNETRKEVGSGSVGGYKTIIERDEFGREVSRERVPTGRGGSSGSGSEGNGSSASKTPPSKQKKDKTPPSKQKKDDKKTPPSKRK